MSTCVAEYADADASMVELVFAPASIATGAEMDWIRQSDETIVDATLGELARLFPSEIANDPAWPATASQGAAGRARLRKHAVVRVPRSVYAATPGRNSFRPSQQTPVSNFVLAGDFTSQKFLGSMEGAVLAGKLAAEVVADAAAGRPTRGLKPPDARVVPEQPARQPVGVRGEFPIAFGGGQQGVGAESCHP
jgi:15-cis-phytoene desaturase